MNKEKTIKQYKTLKKQQNSSHCHLFAQGLFLDQKWGEVLLLCLHIWWLQSLFQRNWNWFLIALSVILFCRLTRNFWHSLNCISLLCLLFVCFWLFWWRKSERKKDENLSVVVHVFFVVFVECLAQCCFVWLFWWENEYVFWLIEFLACLFSNFSCNFVHISKELFLFDSCESWFKTQNSFKPILLEKFLSWKSSASSIEHEAFHWWAYIFLFFFLFSFAVCFW